MQLVVTLLSIPALTVAGAYALTPASPSPTPAKAIQFEGVRAQRQDDATFRLRWLPVADMPPMRETVVEPLLLVSTDAPTIARKTERRAALRRLDVCERHRLRKVHYGRTWRCRR